MQLLLNGLLKKSLLYAAALGLCVALPACSAGPEPSRASAVNDVECDPDNGGLALPSGFCATVVADDVGQTRHLTVRENGDIYVRLREKKNGGSIAALRDTDGDGQADNIEYFADEDGDTGIEIKDNHLYYGTTISIHRVPLSEGELVPQADPETLVEGFPEYGQHAAKSLAVDDQENIYVNVGAPSNSCQEQDRTPGSPGEDPCSLLERHGGIWQFSATQTGQTQLDDGHRFATGIRNAVALDWSPVTGNLYAAQHGRDQLAQNWGDLFTETESAILPAEEVFLVNDGDDFGWPYAYYDWILKEKVLSPEYGGDGRKVGRASEFEDPIFAFPGHWGPNDLVFYTGNQFPDRYKNGMFIAFHGSWNRAPIPQEGYRIVYLPFNGEQPINLPETFANGFSGAEVLESPGDAKYRPTGLAVGPDGSLYVSDDQTGRIWRIVYKGNSQ